MKIKRREARVVKIGSVSIGGNHPVIIQSMVKVKTAESERAIAEIKLLQAAGCEVARLAVKDQEDAAAIKKIRAKTKIPLVADIHFDYRLALRAIESGADKIRLNPGNIYRGEEVREVAAAAKSARIPIRVGVNSGSLRASLRAGKSQAEIMVKAALGYVKMLEGFKFYDIVLSLKASTVIETIAAYREIAKLCDYPLHLGVTATGLPKQGMIKSSIACGVLLSEGIGDTLRISLTGSPQEEVAAAKSILSALELRSFGPEIISCPTCGRCEVDLIKIVGDLESRLASLTGKPANRQTGKPIKVAVMGCVVNGPGEAREADLGIAFGGKDGLFFRKGKPVGKVACSSCADYLLRELRGLSG
ncbi:MAG: flavodoxin-dependent (E)-4-hydroxy-3-methylbut-2-enyl-diphosphate synthase [Candidatus Omnitrophota bacterium]|nr:flavodoxin-dependent (E)-4-hydroxy-3-methylbut-2-enyl-diphosphate synthase [Candidatus Omnitrophota bacterium]